MNLNSTILGQSISFFLFVWFCMKYIWPPILTIIEKRQKDISDNLNFVKTERKKLKLDQEKIQEEIENKKKEASKLINQAKKQRNIILEQARIEAEKEKNEFILKAHSEIVLERLKLRQELSQQVKKIAILMAEKIVQRSIKNENDDIINKLITYL